MRSLRHELLDRTIIWNPRRLRALLAEHIQERAPLDKYLHHALPPRVNGVASRMGASPEAMEANVALRI